MSCTTAARKGRWSTTARSPARSTSTPAIGFGWAPAARSFAFWARPTATARCCTHRICLPFGATAEPYSGGSSVALQRKREIGLENGQSSPHSDHLQHLHGGRAVLRARLRRLDVASGAPGRRADDV